MIVPVPVPLELVYFSLIQRYPISEKFSNAGDVATVIVDQGRSVQTVGDVRSFDACMISVPEGEPVHESWTDPISESANGNGSDVQDVDMSCVGGVKDAEIMCYSGHVAEGIGTEKESDGIPSEGSAGSPSPLTEGNDRDGSGSETFIGISNEIDGIPSEGSEGKLSEERLGKESEGSGSVVWILTLTTGDGTPGSDGMAGRPREASDGKPQLIQRTPSS